MELLRVTNRKTKRMFLDTARIIYMNDKTWVCPLDNDIEMVFDQHRNTYFKHGTVERWVIRDGKKRLIGRIAAFIDFNMANTYEQPTGGIGFFECVDNNDAAFLLFDTAKEWLKGKGMEAMDGPINFGETDKYWGLLVKGFTHPAFDVPYNHAYYRNLFESYGFQVYYKMEGFHLDITRPLPERLTMIAERILQNPSYEFRHFTWTEEEKYSRDFAEAFNEAWASFKKNFEPLEEEYIRATLKKARPIIDEEFIWLAYFEEKPIAIFLMFPDLNQILRHFKGKLSLAGKLKFLWLKKRKTMTRAKALLMGVIPKFQNRGIESAFIHSVQKVFESKPHYTEIEFSWIADFNPKMRKLFIAVGIVPVKDYVTFRYLFDRSKEFKRYPIPETG